MNNKQIANRVLAFTALVFLLAVVLKHIYGNCFGVKILYAISEAALVGGIADWFAITALFDRPLGFKWHTRLIPNNRKKLIKGTVNLVQQELLSKNSIKQKISNINLTSNIINWVDNYNGKQLIVSLIERYIQDFLKNLDTEKTAVQLEEIVKTHACQLKLAPLIHDALRWAVHNQHDDRIITSILDELINITRQPTLKIQINKFLRQEKSNADHSLKNLFINILETFNIINYEDAAEALQQELVTTLNDLKNPAHPVRLWLTEQLRLTMLNLAADKHWEDTIDSWKNELVNNIVIKNFVREQLEVIQGEKQSRLILWLIVQLNMYWDLFKANVTMQNNVEKYLHEAIERIIESEHVFIGILVKKAFNVFSDEDLNKFIEEKAGHDLQWIRINGSLVGSMVGLVLFLFLQFVYYPFIVPLVRSILFFS